MSLLELEFKIQQLEDIPFHLKTRQHLETLQQLRDARRDYFSSYGEYLNYIYGGDQICSISIER